MADNLQEMPPADREAGVADAARAPGHEPEPDRLEKDAPAMFRANGERFPADRPPAVQPHDFAQPLVIDEIVQRALRLRHDEFASLLSARLSIFLRMDFGLKLQRLSTLVYRRFTAAIADPSHVVLFKVEPLTGVGVVDISPRLGLSAVDRMLGGNARVEGPADTLTEIEMNLLDDVMSVLLEEWCRMWGASQRLAPSIIGRENGGRYLQTSASDTVMLVAVFEATLGECAGTVQIAIPFPSVEGNVRGMLALLPAAGGAGSEARRPTWTNAYNTIPLPLSVEWDARELAVRDVLALAEGSVVRLHREILAGTRVRLSGVTKFLGEIGLEDGRLAVRIDKKTTPEDM